jgi:DNA repair exonuclease SbcCD nuclease subunit
MGRILHTADLHVGVSTHGTLDPVSGVSTRLLDLSLTLDWMSSLVAEQDLDMVAIVGDVAHARDLSGPELNILRDWLAGLRVPVIIVGGNHDPEKHPARRCALEALAMDDVRVIMRGETVAVAGQPFICVPYPNRTALVAAGASYHDAAEMVAEFVAHELAECSIAPVVLPHMTTAGSHYRKESQPNLMTGTDIVVPTSALNQPGVNVVLMGHIHERQEVGGCHYAGSPLSLDFGARVAKGVNIVDLDLGEVEFVENPHDRRFVTIALDKNLCGPMDGVQPGCFIRLVADQKIPAEARRALTDDLKAQDPAAIYFIEKVAPEVRPLAQKVVAALTPETAIEVYCKEKGGEFAEHAAEILDIYKEVGSVEGA